MQLNRANWRCRHRDAAGVFRFTLPFVAFALPGTWGMVEVTGRCPPCPMRNICRRVTRFPWLPTAAARQGRLWWRFVGLGYVGTPPACSAPSCGNQRTALAGVWRALSRRLGRDSFLNVAEPSENRIGFSQRGSHVE